MFIFPMTTFWGEFVIQKLVLVSHQFTKVEFVAIKLVPVYGLVFQLVWLVSKTGFGLPFLQQMKSFRL